MVVRGRPRVVVYAGRADGQLRRTPRQVVRVSPGSVGAAVRGDPVPVKRRGRAPACLLGAERCYPPARDLVNSLRCGTAARLITQDSRPSGSQSLGVWGDAVGSPRPSS